MRNAKCENENKMIKKKKYQCDQSRCGYLQTRKGCRTCKDCKTESFILDDNCSTCWNCAHDEGILRWDDNKDLKDMNDKELDKTLDTLIKELQNMIQRMENEQKRRTEVLENLNNIH
jgi:ribosomal protein L29